MREPRTEDDAGAEEAGEDGDGDLEELDRLGGGGRRHGGRSERCDKEGIGESIMKQSQQKQGEQSRLDDDPGEGVKCLGKGGIQCPGLH